MKKTFCLFMATVLLFWLPLRGTAAELRDEKIEGEGNLCVLGEADILSEAEWISDDGYLKITTGYTQTDRRGNEKHYTIHAKAEWLKSPLLAGEDVFILGSNCTFNDRVEDVGEVAQVFRCDDCEHKTYRVRTVRGDAGKDGDLTMEYGSGAPELRFTQLPAPTCDNCGSHRMRFEECSVWLQYGIITNESSNIQAVYVHKTLGMGGVKIRIDANGTPNCFSEFGRAAAYIGRPVRIFFNEKANILEMLTALFASHFTGGNIITYGNWQDASAVIVIIVMGWLILQQLKKNSR